MSKNGENCIKNGFDINRRSGIRLMEKIDSSHNEKSYVNKLNKDNQIHL